MSEFAPILTYLVISLLVSLIPLGLPFPFSSNSSTYTEKMSSHECGFDLSCDARSCFDIRFYPNSIFFIIPDPEVTFFVFGQYLPIRLINLDLGPLWPCS
ncbi:NADH-ubiquinone oxidoreductase chain 3 [Dendrobium catenatum]|uniref:NADH-ubiquinone oxidoreductase chain 3 n=1 Tax=Dendrobium catenatum TaxID=906689 RepID=A0A2I0X656_9ASPA|nr:NADH-ubiquinone oxidoreductase chain 3 [Dendrobium catenatum]